MIYQIPQEQNKGEFYLEKKNLLKKKPVFFLNNQFWDF